MNKVLDFDLWNEVNELEEVLFEFEVKTLGAKGKAYYIAIDGKQYGYVPKTFTLDQIEAKFKSILKHSPGKALAWLKKNTTLISNKKDKKR